MPPHLLPTSPLWSPRAPHSALYFDISPLLLHYPPALPELQFSLTLLCPSGASSPSALPAMPPHLLPTSPLWSPRAPHSALHFDISPPLLHYPPALPELHYAISPSPCLIALAHSRSLFCSPLRYPSPPCYITSPLSQSHSPHSPCSVPVLPHPRLPSQLCHLTSSVPLRSGSLVLPFLIYISASPLPRYTTSRNILGNHAAPTTFRNDPGLIYIALDDKVETWTCALCDFTCDAALDSAMVHIQSELHASRGKATAHRPAAKEAFGPWRALTLQQKPKVAAFLRG
ncbi:unnamed protein product [Closterium sp. NIES-65]|nr:unnamed protein product [Closterium sp. NIES-65]